MSIVAPIQEIRRLVAEAADEIPHPTKDREAAGLQRTRHADKPMRYGRVVYIEGGAVAVLVDGKYRVARGGDHDDSLRQLAYVLRLSEVNLDVPVDTLTVDEFRSLVS